MVSVRIELFKMVGDYELSGKSDNQTREEMVDDYGRFDLDKCADGGNQRNFARNLNKLYLLY